MNANEDKAYGQGWQARNNGHDIGSCELMLSDPLRAFWLAGFHDRDYELGGRVLKVRS